MYDAEFWKYFFKFFETLPRQGPGLNSYTAKALACLPELRPHQRILDIGCGVGMQTLELARKSAASIIAIDFHAPFLDMLKKQAAKEGLSDRITTQVADMGELPFEDHSFDVLWAEGSSFIIGYERALELWQRLLKPGGYLVISELTWFTEDPPAELREVCVPDPAEDARLAARREAVTRAGYRMVDDFPLPKEGWWEGYYANVLDQLDGFEECYGEHLAAQAVIERCRHEIDLFNRYSELYGYMFYIMKH